VGTLSRRFMSALPLLGLSFAWALPAISQTTPGQLTFGPKQVDIFGVQADDQVRFRIVGPDGQVILDKEEPVGRTQARRFLFAGRRLHAKAWSSGTYSGRVTLTRAPEGRVMEHSINRTVTIQ